MRENPWHMEGKKGLSMVANMALLNREHSSDARKVNKAHGHEQGHRNNLENPLPNKPLAAWGMNSPQGILRNLTEALLVTVPMTKDIRLEIIEILSRINRRSKDHKAPKDRSLVALFKIARESEDLQHHSSSNILGNRKDPFDQTSPPDPGLTMILNRCSAVSTLVSSKRLTGRAGILHSPKPFKVCKGW